MPVASTRLPERDVTNIDGLDDIDDDSDDGLSHTAVLVTQDVFGEARHFAGKIHYIPMLAADQSTPPTQIWHDFEFDVESKMNFLGRDFWVKPGTSLETRCGTQDYHYHSIGDGSTLHRKCPHQTTKHSSSRDRDGKSVSLTTLMKVLTSSGSDLVPPRNPSPDSSGSSGSTPKVRAAVTPTITVDSPGGTSAVHVHDRSQGQEAQPTRAVRRKPVLDLL